jgi:hypothetical protein
VLPPNEAVTPAPTTTDPPSLNPVVSPYPTPAFVPLEAGRTELLPAGKNPRLTIDLPVGWAKAGATTYVRLDTTPVPLSISAWRLRRVNTFPCRWSAGAFADRSLMESAEGQARALSSWWGQDPGSSPLTNSAIAPLASTPVQTTMLGWQAWSLEILIPTGLDFSHCDGGQLILWDSSDANARYSLGPSEVNRIWVIDIDRGPIVIDAGLSLTASASLKAELQAIIDSLAFDL